MKPEEFLKGLGSGVGMFAPALPQPWRGIVGAIGTVVSVIGSLVGAGRDPVLAVAAFESWARDAANVDSAIDAELARRAGT